MRSVLILLLLTGVAAAEPYRYRGDAYIEEDGVLRRGAHALGTVDVDAGMAEVIIFEDGGTQGIGEIFRLTDLDVNCNRQLCTLLTPPDSDLWGGAALYFGTAFGENYAWFVAEDDGRTWLVYETVEAVAAIPEPGGMLLALAGLICLVCWRNSTMRAFV